MSDDEDTAAAMAAAMGFSSFGAQKSNKRRKFNPSTDAVVDEAASTGSNMIPLGMRKKNTDEVDLDDDDVEEEHTASVSQAAQGTTTDHDDEDPEPQYLDTSRPPAPIVPEPTDELQSMIDTIVGSSADTNPPPQVSSSVVSSGLSIRGGRGGRQRNMNRDGRPGTKWWEGYYDPAFITNPWEKLEKSIGLEPRGPWVSWEEAKAAQV
ncbi:hypothetical protein HD806DRAFT_294487 [Xylariaceae sp. AK1471]|nr:hypothetical protein HD806DRAFT_294487 [Xylariaceae sp. AK1471]